MFQTQMPNGVTKSIVPHLSQRLYVQTLAIAEVFNDVYDIIGALDRAITLTKLLIY